MQAAIQTSRDSTVHAFITINKKESDRNWYYSKKVFRKEASLTREVPILLRECNSKYCKWWSACSNI